MKLESLHDLYLKGLRNIYDAEKRILKAMPRTMESANSSELRTALARHFDESKSHVARIEEIFKLHNVDPRTETCEGMKGILAESDSILPHSENRDVRDAGIVEVCQKVEHYEKAAYACLRNWAEQMGHSAAMNILQQTFEEEQQASENLRDIGGRLNAQSVRHAG